jgi:hypothetical protein
VSHWERVEERLSQRKQEEKAKADLHRKLTRKEIIDRAILPMLMLLGIIECVRKHGIVFRADMLEYLQLSVQHCFAGFPKPVVTAYVKESKSAAKKILDAMNPDDERQAVKAAAMLITLMAEQGLLVDTSSQAVLAALMVVDEAQSGENPAWGPWIDSDLKLMVSRGLRAAELMGHL